MTKEAMKLALDALIVCRQSNYGRNWCWPDTAIKTALNNVFEAIEALEEALKQEQGEQLARLGWQEIDCPICGGGARAFPKQEQEQGERVAWMTINEYGEEDDIHYENPEGHLMEGWTYKPLYTTPQVAYMRMPKVGDRVVCIEDEDSGIVQSLTAGGSPEIKFDDGSHGTYLLREFAELFRYADTTPQAKEWVGLTADELNAISDRMKTWNSFQITDIYFAIEGLLKERNR